MKKANKVVKWLKNQENVRISFTKKDGSERKANVTWNLNMIPKEFHPKGMGKPKPDNLIRAYDLSTGKWISFYCEKLLTVKTPPTASQLRRKKEGAERWKIVSLIVKKYQFTIGQALSIASGKTVDGCNLKNLSLY